MSSKTLFRRSGLALLLSSPFQIITWFLHPTAAISSTCLPLTGYPHMLPFSSLGSSSCSA